MTLHKNDDVQIEIDGVTSEGSGVGRYEGMAVFVRGAVPGDVINAHIIKASKNYAVGIIGSILQPSPSRIESDCPFSSCGGCSFRNMTYDAELKYKYDRVREALHRIGGIDIQPQEITGADNLYGYRNKAQYPVSISGGEMKAGFYAYKSHRLVPCENCLLQPEEFQKGIDAFAEWAKMSGVTSYDEKTGKGILRHIYFRKGVATGDVMACAVINAEDIKNKELLISLLRERVKGLKSVVLNINKENTNVVLGSRCKTVWGDGYITDVLLGKRFIISPLSFYQVNHAQCEKLYTRAREYAQLSGSETLLDLYCGVGTVGLTMADGAKRLIGIEIVPQAVENAKENARINSVTNSEFFCADAAEGAKILKNRGIKPDVIIVDPPRKGCDNALLDVIADMSPRRIVYISCDCATLARDLAILREKNYFVQKATPVDMFPRTPHVETVALLTRGR